MTDSTIPFFSFQYPFAEEAHCTVSPTLKFSILLRLFRPFIADCQSASLPTIERTAGTCKVRCTVVALFLDALDMLAIRAILCRRMFLPVYAIFCDSWHIIPRASYARPTVWGMKSPAGGGRGVGCFNIEVTVRSFGDSYIESKRYAGRVREYTLHILRVFPRLLSTDNPRNMSLHHRSVRSLCIFR